MQAVMLHEAKVGGDAIEEERVEQRAIFGRKLRIDAFEGPAVIGPEIRCRAHAAEKNGNVAIGEALQDRLDRGARHLRLDPAQHVVGAELDDHGVGAFRHRPIEPRQPAGSGIAGDAGIDDLRGNPFGGERCLQTRHEAVLFGQAQTRCKGITERHDLDRRAGFRRRDGSRGDQRDATNRRTQDLAQTSPAPI